MIHVSIAHYRESVCTVKCPPLSNEDIEGIKEVIKGAMVESLHGIGVTLRFDYDELRYPAESDTCTVIEVRSRLNQLHEKKIISGIGKEARLLIAKSLPAHGVMLLVVPEHRLHFT